MTTTTPNRPRHTSGHLEGDVELTFSPDAHPDLMRSLADDGALFDALVADLDGPLVLDPNLRAASAAVPVTTTLEALGRGQVTVAEEPAPLDQETAPMVPLGAQGTDPNGTSYFEDIANVDATDEVPTWDVRPVDGAPALLRPVFLHEVEDTLDDTAEASLWWMPVVQEQRKRRPAIVDPPHAEDSRDDTEEAFHVLHTEEADPDADEPEETGAFAYEETGAHLPPPPPPTPRRPPPEAAPRPTAPVEAPPAPSDARARLLLVTAAALGGAALLAVSASVFLSL